jgi:hypothetical protein
LERNATALLIGSDATERVREFADRVFSLPRIPKAREGAEILAEIEVSD